MGFIKFLYQKLRQEYLNFLHTQEMINARKKVVDGMQEGWVRDSYEWEEDEADEIGSSTIIGRDR